jgi:uncharacterized glyoxalase superfamily protein PhnB
MQALSMSFAPKGTTIMRTFHHAKAMAKTLRAELRGLGLPEPSHAQCLEIVAKQFGVDDWNVLAAALADADRHDDGGFKPAVPILRMFSVEKAREFYLDFLGFELSWEHRFEDDLPLYMQVERGGTVLHLSEHHEDGSPGAIAFVPMRGLDAFQRELAAKDYTFFKPAIEDVPWGARWMVVTDPFGNRLRFNEYRTD